MHVVCNGCPDDGDCCYQIWEAPEECDIIGYYAYKEEEAKKRKFLNYDEKNSESKIT